MQEESTVIRSRMMTSDDLEWGIRRAWVRQLPDGTHTSLSTRELAQFHVLCCLGSGGLGKTWEIVRLAQMERDNGRAVSEVPLARYSSADALRGILRSKLVEVGPTGAMYLDGLDELMVPLRYAASVISEWIDEELRAQPRVALRLSCRSGVWPKDLLQTIHRTHGSERVGVCELQPLDEEQIEIAAASRKLDSAGFLRAVHEKGCLVLAQQPLMLKLLLQTFESHSDLPGSRSELFDDAITRLCSDPVERRESGTTISAESFDELVGAAERLAMIMTLSGRDTVDMNDDPADRDSLGLMELTRLPSGARRRLDFNMLWTLAYSRLMRSHRARQYEFLHRQFAEHLAGRRLATLPVVQAMGFLASDAGRERGVAGPLREVAAVAATYNNDIAAWIARTDPEIIGLSEVAGDKLRKVALLGLFEKFRRNELTDAQIPSDKGSFAGLKYPTVAEDVAAVLREREARSEDVHAFAIALCGAWRLESAVPELVSCALDRSLPLHTRSAAAFGVEAIGTSAQRQLLKPLMSGGDDDADQDLKGIALSANWPEHISASELFAVLTQPRRDSYLGHYRFFLHRLDKDEFDGSSDLVAALTWVRGFIERSDFVNTGRALMRRIVIAAVKNADDRDVLEALAAFVWHASKASAASLFEDSEARSALISALGPTVRREMLSSLMTRGEDWKKLWDLNEHLPGILDVEDFPWLLARACDLQSPNDAREWAASLAGWLDWQSRREFIDLWLTASLEGTLPDSFKLPLLSDPSSKQAIEQRSAFQKRNRARRRQTQALTSPPAESIETMLERCEQGDLECFAQLSREWNRIQEETYFHLHRFLTSTPGWVGSDMATRRRVVVAAKAYLGNPSEFMKRVESAQPNEVLNDGGMAALFLLQSEEPSWLEGRSTEWWMSWAPYVLREMYSDLSGEPQEPKQQVVALLHRRAVDAVRAYFLSAAQDPVPSDRFSGLCRLLSPIEDESLDERLTDAVIDGKLGSSAVTAASEFILRRSVRSSARLVETVLRSSSNSEAADDARVRVSAAALSADPPRYSKQILDFMRSQPALSKAILQMYANNDFRNGRGLLALGPAASGELLELLFDAFPPEADPVKTGAYWLTAKDAAIALRNSSIVQLARNADPVAASKIFAKLDAKFGSRYPWLRRPRAEVERRLLLTSWAPLPPVAIAATLASGERRLLRSPADVLDVIRFAVEQYEWSLQSKVPANIQDLWDTPRKQRASPKDEEVVSDKLLAAIEETFKGIAVVASREVQLFRRIRSGAQERAGTRADLMLKLAASGAHADEKISVVIEVKRSCNSEAKSGLRKQLVDLYLLPQDYTHGAFVVAYLNAESLAACHKPVWKTIEDARTDITRQAEEVNREFAGNVVVAGIVIDARLPSAIPVVAPIRRSRRLARKIAANRSN